MTIKTARKGELRPEGPSPRDERWDLAIGEAYRAAAGAVPETAALERLAEVTQSDKAFYCVSDTARGASRIVHWFNAEPHFIDNYNQFYAAKNEWLAQGQFFQAEGLVWTGSSIVAMEALKKTEFYDLVLAPQAIFHTLHIILAVEGPRAHHLILTRRPIEANYDEGEIEPCRAYAAHARRALDLRRSVERKAMVQGCLADLVDQSALGIAVIEPPAGILTMSEACETMLATLMSDDQVARFRTARRTHSQAAVRLHMPRALSDAITRHNLIETIHLALDRSNHESPLIARLKPMKSALGAIEERTVLALILYDPEQPIEIDEDVLKTAYGLTAAEARVCSLLVAGERIEEVANQLSISPHTARTHLKRIFEKTRSNRQAELVMRVLSTARRKPTPRPPQPSTEAAKSLELSPAKRLDQLLGLNRSR